MTEKSQPKHMRIPIAVKLVTITSLLMLAATVPITLKSSKYFEDRSKARESDLAREKVKIISSQVEETLMSLIDKAKVIGSILYNNMMSEKEREAALTLTFRSDRDLVTVEVIHLKDAKPILTKRIVNEDYLKQYNLKADYIDVLRQQSAFPMSYIFNGEIEVYNSSSKDGAPLITIGIPLVKDESGAITDIVLTDIRLDRIQKLFSQESGAETTFLVDKVGTVLAHPDDTKAMRRDKMDTNPMVKEAVTKVGNVKQRTFTDPLDGKTYIGAIAKTAYGPIAVSIVPEEIVLATSRQVRRQALQITGYALFSALFFIVLFSSTLTRPLQVLVTATKAIAKGNFDTRAHITTKDEVGELAEAFDQMIIGLKERDKVKNLFNKFHGTGVANQLMTGELKLGGEQREATVFFSDIRDFTSFSEKVEAQVVVDMLNEYFKVMVAIITKNKGVVDKFIGDAIMAVWGVPESSGNDAAHAILACLEMRVALATLNESRIKRGQPELRIGMGVHSGPLIAGTIGSDDRMEYTVIGDTVNMGSRVEAATKSYGLDLLISESTYEKVKEYFIIELAGTAEVKGKSEPIKLYKVTGYIDEDGHPVEVKTAYSSYTAEHSEKVKTA